MLCQLYKVILISCISFSTPKKKKKPTQTHIMPQHYLPSSQNDAIKTECSGTMQDQNISIKNKEETCS